MAAALLRSVPAAAARAQRMSRTWAAFFCRAYRHSAEEPLRRQTLGAAWRDATDSDLDVMGQMRRNEVGVDGRSFAEVRREIFEHPPPPPAVTRSIGDGRVRDGTRFLRQPLKGPEMLRYYPPDPIHTNAWNPFRHTPKQERWYAKLATLKQRGKAPPRQGEGKRAAKRKK